jgi:hypothetical protein
MGAPPRCKRGGATSFLDAKWGYPAARAACASRLGGAADAALLSPRVPPSPAPQLVAGGEFFTLTKVERIEKVSDKLGIPDPALSS